MNRLRKSMSVVVLGAVGAAGVMFGNGLLRDVQFARAEAQVQSSREQLAKADDLSSVFRNVGKAVEPTVVKIEVHKTIKNTVHHSLPFNDDMLKRMFPDRDGDGEPDLPPGFSDPNGGGDDDGSFDQLGTGSGVIMEVDGSTGYILTNNHVAGGAEEMTVSLSDGRVLKGAKTLGADPKSDLAIVKVEADHLIAAKWGDSATLQKGDWVMAFGSPFGYVGSMTHGIVSALNRDVGILRERMGYENFIQVDAPINPGNSGGPLVDVHGDVVGISTAIASRSGGFQGIGFAIPSNQAKFVYAQLKTHGKVTRGWLGVSIVSVDDPSVSSGLANDFGYEKTTGVLVHEVIKGTPAYGKLQAGDIVTKIDGKDVKDSQELRNAIAAAAPGKEIALTVFREKKTEDVKVKVGEQPDDMRMASRGNRGGPGGDNADTGKTGIGLGLADINDEIRERFGIEAGTKGALVREVDPKSAAAKEGIRPGDVITKVGDKAVSNASEAREALSKADLAKGVRLYVVGKDASRFVYIQKDK